MISYEISDDFERLTLTVAEGAELDPDDDEIEIVEGLIANSGLSWLAEGTTGGDLTSAPMLAICGPTEPGEGGVGKDAVSAGFWDSKHWCNRVLARWAWMDYQVKSMADELRENRKAVLHGGLLNYRAADIDANRLPAINALPELVLMLDQPELDTAHDWLSDLVEDPAADPVVLRDAVVQLLLRLNALHEKRGELIKRMASL